MDCQCHERRDIPAWVVSSEVSGSVRGCHFLIFLGCLVYHVKYHVLILWYILQGCRLGPPLWVIIIEASVSVVLRVRGTRVLQVFFECQRCPKRDTIPKKRCREPSFCFLCLPFQLDAVRLCVWTFCYTAASSWLLWKSHGEQWHVIFWTWHWSLVC